jgi:hypothetical protein
MSTSKIWKPTLFVLKCEKYIRLKGIQNINNFLKLNNIRKNNKLEVKNFLPFEQMMVFSLVYI